MCNMVAYNSDLFTRMGRSVLNRCWYHLLRAGTEQKKNQKVNNRKKKLTGKSFSIFRSVKEPWVLLKITASTTLPCMAR